MAHHPKRIQSPPLSLRYHFLLFSSHLHLSFHNVLYTQQIPHLSVYVLSAPSRTSPFPDTHINPLTLFLQAHAPMLFCDCTHLTVTFCCFTSFIFFLIALITIWHNIHLPDYVPIIHFPTECMIPESWNLVWFAI